MKKKSTLLLACLFLLLQLDLSAQSACDGARYIDDIFAAEDIAKTTVQYGQNVNILGQDQDLMMDIYTPAGDDPTVNRPVIIFAHGGTFIFGDRTYEEAHCREYARKGFVTASIDYRLWSLFGGIPDSTDILQIVVMAVSDMKAAVRYFRADAAGAGNYNIDPNLIFVGGTSAGAITATHTAYMQPEDDDVPTFISDIIEAQGGIEGTSGNPGYSSAVSGVLNLSGGLYKPEWITADEAPMVSYHGDADGTVPYEFGLAANIMSIHGSANMHARMENLQMHHHLYTVEGGGHTDIYEGGAQDQEWPIFRAESAGFLEAIICESTSSQELAGNAPSVKIYPNPAYDAAWITIANPQESYDLFVYDQLGRRVYAAPGNTDAEVNLKRSALGSGLFYVQVILEDGRRVTEQLVFE